MRLAGFFFFCVVFLGAGLAFFLEGVFEAAFRAVLGAGLGFFSAGVLGSGFLTGFGGGGRAASMLYTPTFSYFCSSSRRTASRLAAIFSCALSSTTPKPSENPTTFHFIGTGSALPGRLRAVAGALLIQVLISPWLYLGVGGLGLILALGRIQHEMRLAAAAGILEPGKYSLDAVTQMNSVTMTSTLMVYCLYTFLAPGFESNHLMMLTIPTVIYGLFRYRYLTIKHAGDQSPEQLMLSDAPLLIAVALWAATAAAVLYLGS